MFFNYAVGVLICSPSPTRGQFYRRVFLTIGVATNLACLGYFKYANFFVDNFNAFTDSNYNFEHIVLPLAISFFTFQQIAYLVDTYNGETREYNFLHYCLFVVFFPQLIAGPIVHHKEMLPQFARSETYRLRSAHLAVGITILAIGLFKKVVLADGIAVYATPVFDAAEQGVNITFFEAWGATLAYTFQLYFDFSGYSDMAIGLARMFGVRLPLNFNSPYKATSIIDFWRRWHITLSRFLRDYLYFPLGGSRRGETRRMSNLMITMLLGGLWHGAGWTFVLWGGLHGFYLVINHLWRKVRGIENVPLRTTLAGRASSWILTMLAIVVAWVPFRAESMTGASNMLAAMGGLHGFAVPQQYLGYMNHLAGLGDYLASAGWQFTYTPYFGGLKEVFALAILLLIACGAPNTQQLIRRYRPAFETYKGEIPRLQWRWMEWRPTVYWALITAISFVVSLTQMQHESEFLYFQF